MIDPSISAPGMVTVEMSAGPAEESGRQMHASGSSAARLTGRTEHHS